MASKRENPSLNSFLIGIGCALLIGMFTWLTDPKSPDESLNPNPENTYYNQLMRGFLSGHLNINVEVPPGFQKLANPYDPTQNRKYRAPIRDTSYYKGKFYLYFGVTPVVLLYLPWTVITGHYLSDRDAVAIFFSLGFLVIWQLLCEIRRRYFPEIRLGSFAPGIFILGLILGLTQGGLVFDVASVSTLAFAMLALGGIWLALHESSTRRIWCLAGASLCYGLAIGSRPSLLLGAVILLLPVAQSWHEAAGAVARRRAAFWLVPAIGPILLVGIGLMIYNNFRFDSPFEFGRRYQLTQDYDSSTAQQLNPHYLGFNLRYYFWEPVRWSGYFPFIQETHLTPLPSGYAKGLQANYGGIFYKYPFIFLVFSLSWLWRNKAARVVSALRWFMIALFLLFVACTPIDCLLLTASMRYALDFLPPLMLLAFVGFLGLEQSLVHLPGWRRVVLFGWYLLLGYSLALNSFTNIKARAYWNSVASNSMLAHNQPKAAVDFLQNAVFLDPGVALYHNQLALAYLRTGRPDNTVDELEKVLAIDPNSTDAEYHLGSLLYESGQSDKAFEYFEKALNGDPNHTNSDYASDNIQSARLIMSNPDPGKKNVALALKLSEAASRETDDKDPQILVILAAVCAEAGRTNEALATAQKAVAEAKQKGESNVLETAQSLLNMYHQNETLSPPDQGTIQQK